MAINLSSKKILVVENQAIMRETIKHILGLFNAQFIVETESGVNALTAMKINRFDIVLCDYNLPKGKNGQQVLEEARYLKLLPVNAIFIMVTFEQRLEMVLSTIDNKPDEYLIKPFNRLQLLNRIERCHARKTYLACIENEIDNGNLYQAIQNCERLLQQDDKKMRMQLLKLHAELTVKVGDFKTAEKIYRNILHERELPWARLGLGVVAFFLGDFDQAIKTFQDLIEQYPMMLEAYDWLVKAHEAMGNDEHAVSSLNSAVTLSPMSILRQKKLASLADKTENLPVAKKAYTATIKLGKNSIHRSSGDYSGLANVYLKSNASDEALKILYELNQQFHNDPEAKLRASLLETEIHQAKGNKALAQQAHEKTVKLNQQFNKQISRELRLEMAKTFYLNGNNETCDEILNDLVKTNIDDKLFIKDIVTLCDAIIGENYAETLIRQIKKELVDINNRGVSLFQEGNVKGALEVFKQAIAKMPSNQTVLLNLIKIIIHDLKTSKPDPEKIISAQTYINKGVQIGIPHNQIGGLQVELDTIQNKSNQ
ncbi:response regulator [Methylobacter sp. Wu8]|uniref:CheY-like chemotaxis protein n=1 Tax=Methylobacter tundripaludum TaxID=173365 RepID=A0A2S6H4E5_9GAMM|nr:response regulator [Methylobacter tundripaludum]MCK9635930.1 response regulator [Methylobacter tundripaludum]PPK72368.1 CheY-like chemotaxis protein [Methylobacter tundripaludum]